MFKFSIPLKIHCWGGLGSQLFALALALDIHQQNPKRTLYLLFHTAGVTHRNHELTSLPEFIKHKVINDFKQRDIPTNSKRIIRTFILGFIKQLLNTIRLSVQLKNDQKLKRIKPWTFAIRGHYSDRTISISTIEKIMEMFNARSVVSSLDSSPSHQVGLHYRLGDLLKLTSKTYISTNRVHQLVSQLKFEHNVHEVDVYSDSYVEVENFLLPLKETFDLKFFTCEANEVIKNLMQYKYFIGTNSKITIWATLFRMNLSPDLISYAPIELKNYLDLNIGYSKYRTNLNYY